MRFAVCLAACFSLHTGAFAQGFNTFSGRNHPELEWKVAETEHFEIMYPERLTGIEAEAAPIAEATYDALSANLNVTFGHKIRIYLSDEDEVVNGFAMPINNAYTDIWVHVNELWEGWTGDEKWLRKVIAHELTHIFHYQAVKSKIGWLANLIAEPMPRFWTEGLAQYETEEWDAQRGDRWLRTAVLSDRLSYSDGTSIWNGRLHYAVGNAQVRYFAETYGDSALASMLAHRKKTLLGLARVHDFQTAFRATVDKTYRQFYDDWRRHVNVYYNTIAGQLGNVDSLGVRPLAVPGDYYSDIQYSPDTTKVAVVAITSLAQPIRRLYVVDRSTQEAETVAEGPINAPVAWSPDSRRIAYSRLARGDYGSMLNDLYIVDADGGNRRRLTHSRRASAPAFSPDGRRLAFIGTEGGTANVYLLDLETGQETQVTRFEGDVQLSALRWHPWEYRLVFARFDADGTRELVLLDLASGRVRPITHGEADDRFPVWSPDGSQIGYTSLRDYVPNTFVYDLATGSHRRVTNVATGATLLDWVPPDSAHPKGSLVVTSSVTKSQDQAYRIPADRTATEVDVQVPEAYADWTTHRPPNEVATAIAPDPSLVTRRYDYNSWANISHAASLVVPYYDSPGDWGIVGTSVWLEPLAKHLFTFVGGLSIPSPWERSLFAASYVNNQWYPTVALNVYRMPTSTRFYGSDLLVENYGGGDVTMSWPLDWVDVPYFSTQLDGRLRYVDVDPLELEAFEATDENLPEPESGQLADLRLTFTQRKQRPYRYEAVHPLDGLGWRAQATGAAPFLGADRRFVRGDLAAFGIFKTFGLQRVLLYGRAQAQEGSSFAQDFVGLSRYDDLQLAIPGYLPFTLGDTERVRGYRRFALGNRMLFGTLEYRVPLLPSLQTTLLGFLSLGSTSIAAFADGGLVWTDGDFEDAVRRVGVGLELKNALNLGGFFEIGHALGIAQPAEFVGTTDRYEIYYRIRAAVPF